MNKFKIAYGSIGIVLIILLIVTSSRGLSNKSMVLYDRACRTQESVEKNIWKGFRLNRYPVAIRQGEREYVFYKKDVSIRKPLLPVYACSAYPNDNIMNILIPSFEEMNVLGDIVEGMSSGTSLLTSQFGFSKGSVTEERYIAIMFHEAFHAYQFSEFEKSIFSMFKNDIEIKDIVEKIDKTDFLRNLYQKEGEILYKAIMEEDDGKVREYAREYIEVRNKRTEELKNTLSKSEFDTLMEGEKYYELIEGSARYVEAKTVELLESKKLFNKYIENLKEYSDKTEKYYRSGMGMCLLMDRLDIEWKNIFFEGKPLYEKFCDI